MKDLLDGVFGFFVSDKFYLPIIYILVGIIIYNVFSYIVTRASKVNLKTKKLEKVEKRKVTMISLVKNIIKYAIGIFVILAILEVYGMDTTKIIASLGIMGAVIGLAFQDIIKDLIAGFFIIFDNEYSVGDYVKINDFTGEVIAIGMKTTKIKAYTGEVKIISNSSFHEVVNYNMALSKLVLDIPVSYKTDIDKLEDVLEKIKPDISKIENVRSDIELLGVTEFGESAIVYRIAVDCLPYTHIGVRRKILKLVKNTLDKNNIEIPYNKLDIYIKEKR